MRSCILHYGMHKTGSTSIQHSLNRSCPDERFHYVNLGSPNASEAISTGFKRSVEEVSQHRLRGTSVEELRRMRAAVVERLRSELQTEKRTAIISAEHLSAMEADELASLCENIRASGRVITAVGYVRTPKAFIDSMFQQRVKAADLGRLDLDPLYPRYRKRFEKFDQVLGGRNVEHWLFQPACFKDGCVVMDFCNRIGMQFSADRVVHANQGISRPALSLMYAYRKYGPGYGSGPDVVAENGLLLMAMQRLDGPKATLHSSLVAPILERYREDIAWMESRTGFSLAEDLTANDPAAIRGEEDLLSFEPEALKWLAEQLGPDYVSQWRPGMSPAEVARWVHEFRLRLVGERRQRQAAAGSSRSIR